MASCKLQKIATYRGYPGNINVQGTGTLVNLKTLGIITLLNQEIKESMHKCAYKKKG